MAAETTKHNKGVLPASFTPETSSIEKPFVENGQVSHARHPRIKRNCNFIIMAISAICGVISGVILSRDTCISAQMLQANVLPFGKLFIARVVIGAILLGVEFLLGLFVLGDLFVWCMPFVGGIGLSIRVIATRQWLIMPSSLITLGVFAFSAAVSAGFSQLLANIARGGTVHLASSPKRAYHLSFIAYFAIITACSLYEAIVFTATK